jgi:formamidopyrimidine-DNA glycosylase
LPELPEVEVIRRDLEPRMVGRAIAAARITEPRLTRRHGPPSDLAAAVTGRRVTALRRRGKWILCDLGGETLIVRLGMTGQLLWADDPAAGPDDRHVHARLTFVEGGALRYRDARKFGEMFLLPTAEVERRLRIGVEPLVSSFTAEVLAAICRTSRMRIKSVLLDQHKIAGVGNIYADEALFRAKVRPTRRAGSLRPEEVRALWRCIRRVLAEAVRHRGSSISDYRDACGNPGQFAVRHRVYHRHGTPCGVCGTPVRRILLGQRGTHFCPRCQR